MGGTHLDTVQFATNQNIRVLINNNSSVFDYTKGVQSKDSGLLYDIWKEVKSRLSHKYTFEETVIREKNFDRMIEMVHQGETDVVVAPFQITRERSEKVDFTMTILESKDTVIFFPKNSTFDIIRMLFWKVFLGPILVLFVSGLVFGTLLYIMEPKRYKKAVGVNKKFAFRRTIVTTTAALFGEAGFLSENTTLSMKGIFTMFLIMTFAFFFVMYIQAITTEKVLDIRHINSINRDNIKHKTIMAPKGYAIAKNIERLGGKVVYINDSLDNVIKQYINDPTQADGVAIDYLEAKSRQRDDINLVVNESELGFKEISFAVTKNKIDLLRDINKEIVHLQDTLKTENICKSYMPPGTSYLCVK
jgi:ABC-type amino acid transport substrate-binding protein